MNPNWAEENLQTIRTLMERSALYRRALAPIMLLAGALGVVAAAAGLLLQLNSYRGFLTLWFGAAMLAILGALLITRRQALKDKETFWSPPTRRVALALLPPLLVGMLFGIFPAVFHAAFEAAFQIAIAWILFYGLALHAAGFFMPRGIKVFGWLFIAGACLLFYAIAKDWMVFEYNAHLLMGFFFGVLHLAYGFYLYFTEKKNPVA
jgi:hypothetical protein